MLDDKTYEADYTKGFNEGYLIAKHLPELGDQLSEIKSETPRIDGFKDGRVEFFQEKIRERVQGKNLSRTLDNKDDKSRDDKAQKDIEPELE